MPARQDGLFNAMTGLGHDELDMRQHTHRKPCHQRSVAEYEAEWYANWMAYREVSQRARDMYRAGFKLERLLPETLEHAAIMSFIEGDQKIGICGGIDRQMGLLHYARKLREQGDKVGGAALLAIVDDGLDPVEPLDVRRIQRVVGWEVLDRSELTPYMHGATLEPEYYMLSHVMGTGYRKGKDKSKSKSKSEIKPGDIIHASRLYVHQGRELSRREERQRQFWGGSVLDMNWLARRAVEEGLEYAQTYLDRTSWLHLGIANLDELLREEDELGNPIGERLLTERVRLMRKLCRVLGVAVTDAGSPLVLNPVDQSIVSTGRNPDTLESVVETIGDLTKILEAALSSWQSGASIPRSIAFGEASSALRGGDNSGDWQSWQGEIDNEHNSPTGTPLINWMLTITCAAREGPTGGLLPTGYTLVWNPLIVTSAKEKAEIALLQAQAANAWLEKEIARVDEVRQQRLVNGDMEGPLRAEPEPEELDMVAPVVATEDAIEGDDPLDLALAELPADAMVVSEIVETIKSLTNLDVSTQLVHALARRHGVRQVKVGGGRGYSFADIKRAVLADNDLSVGEPVAPVAPVA